MVATESTGDRRRLGAWPTPPTIVSLVVDHAVTADWLARRGAAHHPLQVLDPACGDGRFLAAARNRIDELGADLRVHLAGVDLDPVVLERAALPGAELRCADALALDWPEASVDLVVGNPPFLSQLAAETSRGGRSRHGGGPYADAAVEFLALAGRVVAPGGRIALVLPQSILASRDAAPVRSALDVTCDMVWSWWSPRKWFDADVLVCAVVLERTESAHPAPTGRAPGDAAVWSHVVTEAIGLPALPTPRTAGVLADRATLNANFRDEYYGLVGAVVESSTLAPDERGAAPPLVTSGLIDPGRCHWGDRPVRFAKRTFDAPRVDLRRLDDRMTAWARRKLVPKVLVANQTRIIEAVADPAGAWLPGVPTTTVTPRAASSGSTTVAGGDTAVRAVTVAELAAVLTSPVASLAAWHAAAGTGLSARNVRLGPSLLGGLAWPAGDLGEAVTALARGDLLGCGRAVTRAYGVDDPEEVERLLAWWRDSGSPAGLSGPPGGATAPSASTAPTPATRRSSTTARGRRAR
jgi:SAM-dependent methyltransferase